MQFPVLFDLNESIRIFVEEIDRETVMDYQNKLFVKFRNKEDEMLIDVLINGKNSIYYDC